MSTTNYLPVTLTQTINIPANAKYISANVTAYGNYGYNGYNVPYQMMCNIKAALMNGNTELQSSTIRIKAPGDDSVSQNIRVDGGYSYATTLKITATFSVAATTKIAGRTGDYNKSYMRVNSVTYAFNTTEEIASGTLNYVAIAE